MTGVADDPRTMLRDAVNAVAPIIRAHADATERGRQLAPAVVDALHERRLFRMLLPRAFGGWEVDPATFAEVIEEIARVDGSVGWCLCQGSGCSMIAAYLPPSSADTIFGADPRGVVAWGQPVGARAIPVPGGYRVTARWAFASGSHHATWLGGISPIFEPDGSPRLRLDGTHDARTILFPAERAELLDVWRVSGLRGTGSDTIAVADVFVPEEHTARQAPDERRESGTLYTFSFTNLYASGFGSVALGIARGLLDAFVDLATTKTPARTKSALRDNAVIQSEVGRAEATLGSARAYLHATLREVYEAVDQSGALTIEQRVRIRLAATYATHRAVEVADTLFHAAGSTAIFEENPFERRFRDIHAVAQQVQARRAHFETVGQFFLGLEPSAEFL